MSGATMTRLRDLGDWSGGNTPSKANAAYWIDGAIPWVSPKDMKIEEITSSGDRVTEAALKDGRVSLLPEGSVLVVTRSGILSHALPVAVTKVPVTINQDLKALTPKPGVLPKYVAHALRGASRRILKECSKHGTTVASIETNALLHFEIPLVDLDEQRHIVAELEKQFSRLDEAVANLKRVKANLANYRAAVLSAAVAGELLLRVAEPTGCGQGLAGATKGLPRGWELAVVEDLCETIVDCPHSTARFQPEGLPCIDTTWMSSEGLLYDRARYVDLTTYTRRTSRLVPRAGDVVFAREGTIGTAVMIPQGIQPCLGQRVMLLRTNARALNRYIVHALHSERVRAQYRDKALGSTVAHINVRDVKRLVIPLPPIEEQHRIVAEVDRRLSIVREVEAEVDANLKRAQALRQAVLGRAFAPGSQANKNCLDSVY